MHPTCLTWGPDLVEQDVKMTLSCQRNPFLQNSQCHPFVSGAMEQCRSQVLACFLLW